MNLDTGEIRQFNTPDEIKQFFDKGTSNERWVQIDPKAMTKKQRRTNHDESADHRSALAVQRDILKKRKRSANRKKKKEA